MSKFTQVELKKKSSNIELALYNSGSSTLRVKFRGGRVYEYRKVSQGSVDEMSAAKSAGSYFSKFIKAHPLLFPVSRMDDDADSLEDAEDSNAKA